MRDINAAAAMSRCSSFDDTTILGTEMDTNTLNHNDNAIISNTIEPGNQCNGNNLASNSSSCSPPPCPANDDHSTNSGKGDDVNDSNTQNNNNNSNNNNNNNNNNINISTLPRGNNSSTGGPQYSFRTNTMAHVCWHRSCSIGRDEFEIAFGVSGALYFFCSFFLPLFWFVTNEINIFFSPFAFALFWPLCNLTDFLEWIPASKIQIIRRMAKTLGCF